MWKKRFTNNNTINRSIARAVDNLTPKMRVLCVFFLICLYSLFTEIKSQSRFVRYYPADDRLDSVRFQLNTRCIKTVTGRTRNPTVNTQTRECHLGHGIREHGWLGRRTIFGINYSAPLSLSAADTNIKVHPQGSVDQA